MKHLLTAIACCLAIAGSAQNTYNHDSDGDGCITVIDVLSILSVFGGCTEADTLDISFFYFHGGGGNGYPYCQSSSGLTDPNPQVLYYDDGQGNPYTITYDLDVAMAAVMNGTAGYPVTTAALPAGDFTSMGTSDALFYPLTTTNDFYYIIAPDGLEDLTSVTPQHLVDGGISTNAIQKISFTWSDSTYWLYRLGGGTGIDARTITFSDWD